MRVCVCVCVCVFILKSSCYRGSTRLCGALLGLCLRWGSTKATKSADQAHERSHLHGLIVAHCNCLVKLILECTMYMCTDLSKSNKLGP